MARVFYDDDCNLEALNGQTIAVIGYGNQGRSQALNLMDSGLDVIVGNKDDDYTLHARADGMRVYDPLDAASKADVIMLIIPDEVQPNVYSSISSGFSSGTLIIFSHGYNIHYRQITPTEDVDIGLVAPRMIGEGVRNCFEEGFPSLVGVEQDASGTAWQRTLAIARGIGGTRKGAWETTFEEETIIDLFGEQSGGGAGLQSTIYAFETLVEAGYNPEVVLLELYASGEMAEVYKGVHRYGLLESLKMHSPTSQYGQMSRAARLVPGGVKQTLQALLAELQDGTFAEEWSNERKSGYAKMEVLRKSIGSHIMFEVEERVLREMQGSKEKNDDNTIGN